MIQTAASSRSHDAAFAGTQEHPIFIVGCQRSGTTLLRVMLNEHPRLAIPPEAPPLFKAIRVPSPWQHVWSVEQAAQVVEEFLAQPKMLRWELSREAVLRELDEKADVRLAAIIRAVYYAYARQHGKVRWGDKTPRNTFELPHLLHAFPEAQVIHLVRDGRDVCLSWAQVDWARYTVTGAAKQWAKWIRVASAVADLLGASRYLEVRYEELVEHPEATLRRICAFLGEPFAPQMLDYHTKHYSAVAGQREQFHRLLDRPPDASRATAWRREMPAADVRAFERAAGATLMAYGYAVSGPTRLRVGASALVRSAKRRLLPHPITTGAS